VFGGQYNLIISSVPFRSGLAAMNAVLSGQASAFIAGPEHTAFAKWKNAELRVIVQAT